MEENNRRLETRLNTSKQEITELHAHLEAVRTESLTDPLTSLANRKFFDIAFAQRYRPSANKVGEPLSLMFADIDHFKNFNDTYGHLIGDQVLRLVAMALKDNVKGRDMAARYGGEEFAVVLPETSLRQATTRRRAHPPRGDGQGIDEALDRREPRPHHDVDRRRDAARAAKPPAA